MRIKAVLRDKEILQMTPGSEERIITAARKNTDRVISWSSLMKVMGLSPDSRTKMLDVLVDSKMHIWLLKEGNQHLIYLTETETGLQDEKAYQWQ